MRILHTADWHLGKRLDFFSRLAEQQQVLVEICQIAEQEQVDMVLIAGDLYDNFNPSNEASELLYKTLKKLARGGKVPVVAIAGNHDSPDRVNVADVLAKENGILFIGNPNDEIGIYSIENGFSLVRSAPGFIELVLPKIAYPVRLLHTAFANEVRLKECFGDDKQTALHESLSKKWQLLADEYCDNSGVNLLTTHLYMLSRGGAVLEEPDGEKPLNIGNADLVYADAIPKQIQYAALGHLHRFQNVGQQQPAIYSSAILQYSFSEAGQEKYVSIIDVEPNEPAKWRKIALQEGKKLHRKSFDEVETAINWLSNHPDTLVELTLVSENFLKAEDRKRIYQTHSGIIHLIPRLKKQEQQADAEEIKISLDRSIDDLFVDYFKSKNEGQLPNADIMSLFKEILASRN